MIDRDASFLDYEKNMKWKPRMRRMLTTAGLLSLVACLLVIGPEPSQGQSALPLLSGFDPQRLRAVYPIRDEPSAGEAGKLVYRLQRLREETLRRLAPSDPPMVGDVVQVEGVIEEIRWWPIPDSLVEFLEFGQLQEIVLRLAAIPESQSRSMRVITTGFPDGAEIGDCVRGLGVSLGVDDQGHVTVAATARLKWFPQEVPNVGVSLLVRYGVDAAAVSELPQRDRLPLEPADAELFYAVMKGADEIAQAWSPGLDGEIPHPEQIDAVALLREPNRFTGQWLRIRLQTVRVTRIAVTDPLRREQLGSDHYFQIDASGDLGNVVISITRPAGESGDPIQFESSYPVSLATKRLPQFLHDAAAQQGGPAFVTAMIAKPVQVDGFFLRLWSYESDFMQRLGGGQQFGPLIIAARIDNLEPDSADPAGVRVIGWIAAAGVLLALVATAIWARFTERHDRDAARQRKKREAEQLQWPD